MRPSSLLHRHHAEIAEILKRYPMISNVRVVGSVARGEDSDGSDLDLYVDAAPETTLFDVGGLREDLVDLLGVPVDIISSGARLHKTMRASMERDAVAL